MKKHQDKKKYSKYENKKYAVTDHLSTTEVYTDMYLGKEGY